VRIEDIQSIEDAGQWCLDAYGVRFIKTFFSKDGLRMLCLYQAPDAESVRKAETQARVPYERAWTCEHIQGLAPAEGGTPGEYVVAERFFTEPVTRESILQGMQQGSSCFDLRRVQHVESFLGGGGHRMVCLFRAPDAEAVRVANRQANAPATAIWTGTVVNAT
jgi:hypothetical protein